jgi:hypothetical protein
MGVSGYVVVPKTQPEPTGRRAARITELERELVATRERLDAINVPEVHDFVQGVIREAAHQRERWGSEHDAGKTPLDWFWLIGYLAQKASAAAIAGDTEKALHHTISTAAALANWHAQILGRCDMRPGLSAEAQSTVTKE